MKYTHHVQRRMGQRGIPERLVRLAQEHGRIEGDRCVLDRREAMSLLRALDAERSELMKVIDKGGIVVVESGDTVITTYNITQRRHEL